MWEHGQIILDKYRLLELIGEGVETQVWLAEEITFGNRLVALKAPQTHVGEDILAALSRRFSNAASVVGMLIEHGASHVVPIYTRERLDEQRWILVMPYMEGGNLADYMKSHRKGVEPAKSVRIIMEVCQGLAFAHVTSDLEIVHRNIKPTNILFDKEGNAHIADFDFALMSSVSSRSWSRIMRAAGVEQSPYLAPELKEGGWTYASPSSDVYAIGCILFELLTGTPYPGNQTPPSTIARTVPPWLDDVVLQCVHPEPYERFENAQDLLEALRSGLEQGEAIERWLRWYNEAQQAMRANQWTTAVKCLEQIVKEAPDYRDARTLLETAREKAEQWARAEKWYKKAQKQIDKDPEAALVSLERAREAWSDFPGLDALEARARQELTRRRLQGRGKAHQEEIIARVRKQRLRAWFEEALSVVDADVKRAEMLYERIRREEPKFPQLNVLREEIERVKRRLAEEAKRARWAQWYEKASRIVEQDPDEAERILKQLRKEAPRYPGLASLEERLRLVFAEREERQRQERLAKLYEKARKLVEEDPKQALSLVHKIRDEAPHYPGLVSLEQKIAASLERRENLHRLIKRAQNLVNDNDKFIFSRRDDIMRKAEQVKEGEITGKRFLSYMEDVISDANKRIDRSKKMIDALNDLYGEHSDIANLVSRLRNQIDMLRTFEDSYKKAMKEASISSRQQDGYAIQWDRSSVSRRDNEYAIQWGTSSSSRKTYDIGLYVVVSGQMNVIAIRDSGTPNGHFGTYQIWGQGQQGAFYLARGWAARIDVYGQMNTIYIQPGLEDRVHVVNLGQFNNIQLG